MVQSMESRGEHGKLAGLWTVVECCGKSGESGTGDEARGKPCRNVESVENRVGPGEMAEERGQLAGVVETVEPSGNWGNRGKLWQVVGSCGNLGQRWHRGESRPETEKPLPYEMYPQS